MIRAEFDFEENGVKAKGFFICLVTGLKERTFLPVECKIEKLFFRSKGSPDFEKIKNLCWKNSIAQIF